MHIECAHARSRKSDISGWFLNVIGLRMVHRMEEMNGCDELQMRGYVEILRLMVWYVIWFLTLVILQRDLLL